ncbi:MAG: nucleotidyltransferase family protein [Longimicrobiales bacterium]
MTLIGLVPAAGQATRIAPLPCSKELFPVGFWSPGNGQDAHPRVVTHHLLEKMRRAGATRAFIVLRHGKWDIPAYFGGHFDGLDLGYLLMRRPFGVPFTLDDAYPFLRDAEVVFGFPDILFQPDHVFPCLLERQRSTGADLAIAIFPARRPEKDDVLELDGLGRIVRIEPKRADTGLGLTWIVATWGPAFTEFMHAFVGAAADEVAAASGRWRGREMYMSDVIWGAVQSGLHVETVSFDDGSYVDIGTPDDLAIAMREHAGV